ncbi:MAG: cation transporter [Desulfobacteraceae bacterium]|nr:MAG: cation transporter [Desulfobacteraceae bacterium]
MSFIDNKKRVAWLSVASNAFLTLIKIATGILTGSVSVLSEAIHSAIDLLAALIATFSVHVSDKPPDPTHPYGHEKIENISGVIEGLLVFVAAVWIIYESIVKLLHGSNLKHLESGSIVMLVSAGLNILVATLLKKSAIKNRSVALEADATHLYTDVYTSIGVFIGLFAISIGERFWGVQLSWLDPAIAMGVALLIMSAAYRITQKSFHPLLDSSASPDEIANMNRIMADFDSRGLDFHKLRTRRAGGSLYVDLHMGCRPGVSLETGHAVSHELKDQIETSMPGAKVLVHVEPSHNIEILPDSSAEVKCLQEVLLKETRISGIHRIRVARFRGDLRVEADLHLDPKVTLAESRALTVELEKKLGICLPAVKEITLSLHPGDGWQKAIHDDDVERIHNLVGEHQSYFTGIHQLDVTSVGDLHRVRLTLGVPAVLPVSAAHLIIRHIETDIRDLFAKGVEIDVHIEPCNENCHLCRLICPKKNTEKQSLL